ncbi:MAG: TetR/AcrR family transcriptional regulator [Gammaproteobacteria bacterium]|nr:TetR/AcrR family transcriptional regulator [Gammaproteobacteria bacterium]MBT5202307.1 TetR/AcrR family transcriptional regulator [Gammaproteobacteria bacterium]MBT5604119.1 TetR/AcrR family transcriptional regulator [Gammaproteobacteria bacterium]MBT6246683.1 TetR/AcrR family transcriptional regulator [Gammaproteobacteria bacterium]
MSDRKREILQIAIEIIADEGYSSLSMRALARASGMKLGALQYHFRTWEMLLRGLVEYIDEAYKSARDSLYPPGESPGVHEIAVFLLDDLAGQSLSSDRLWPQLWAMQQVEPLVSDLLEDIYANYMADLQRALELEGSQLPRAEALFLMSLLEGETLFTGKGRRWESDRKAVREAILQFIDERYGKKP